MTATEQEQRRCDRRDIQRIIGLTMKSPVGPGKKYEVDGEVSFNEIKNKNVDVASRIIMYGADQAARGDIKWAEFLFKYGGFTPAVEAQVEVTLPTFIDDMTIERDITPQVEVTEPAKIEAPAKKKKDVITDIEDVKVCDITKWGS